MLDKNGIEIKTGDVVKIEGAYFKNDNGFWFVEHSAGDADWCGSDHGLVKISKSGKISTAKRNLCFWPIMITTNSYEKRVEAKAWNQEHATIEVVTGIDRSEIAKCFEEKAENLNKYIERLSWDFGEESQTVKDNLKVQEHYKKVASEILSA